MLNKPSRPKGKKDSPVIKLTDVQTVGIKAQLDFKAKQFNVNLSEDEQNNFVILLVSNLQLDPKALMPDFLQWITAQGLDKDEFYEFISSAGEQILKDLPPVSTNKPKVISDLSDTALKSLSDKFLADIEHSAENQSGKLILPVKTPSALSIGDYNRLLSRVSTRSSRYRKLAKLYQAQETALRGRIRSINRVLNSRKEPIEDKGNDLGHDQS